MELFSPEMAMGNPEPIPEDEQERPIVDRCTPLRRKHDVFLSFRGPDTRYGFISHLYHELQTVKRIKTFKDDRDIEKGDPVSLTLLKAIEESDVAVVVLSENYASSAWCLGELLQICQYTRYEGKILPLFYKVEPSDVRHQKGKFGDAFKKLKDSNRHTSDELRKWEKALEKVSKFSGFNTNDHKDEREVLEAMVESVRRKVRPTKFGSFLSSSEFERFGATGKAMDDVMNALKKKEITVVGVHGIGGVGKRTMVEQVGAQVEKDGLFHHVIMAAISHKPVIRNIQNELADMLDVKLVGYTEIVRAQNLRQKMKSENRILVILKDIWEFIDLSTIGIPSLDELKRCNSKILFTTRSLEVCRLMGCHERIPLQILTEDDSWKLFVKAATKSFDESTNFHSIAREVARECAGLPIALKAVAKALGNEAIDKWEVAAKRLKESRNVEKVVFNSIKLSYDYLQSEDSKSCFLLCSLFPGNYDIQIEDLLKYGIGKGLFQKFFNMKEVRDQVHTVVKQLKESSLLLDAKKDSGCVRMHDVIRDVALSISLSENGNPQFLVRAGCELQDWPTCTREWYTILTAISLMMNKIRVLPNGLELSKLQILLLQGNSPMKEIPGEFFQSTEALRVLDLSETIISLPSSFNLLTRLQTLYLDGLSSILNISLLGKLKFLEVLSMRGTLLEKLPKEIGLLTNLRMLDFTGASVYIVPSEVLCNLKKLEELYMQCKFGNWGSDTNAPFDELTGLSGLYILKVFISDANCLPKAVRPELNWVNFDICISGDPSNRKSSVVSSASPDDSRRALTLNTAIDTLPKWFIDVVTEKTEKLQYIKCQNLGDMLVEYVNGRLHALKYLSVTDPDEKLEQFMNASTLIQTEPVFQNLEELHLLKVHYLELCVGQLPSGSLCNLRLLEVKDADKWMNALLQSNMLQRLHNLEKLICERMNKLEYVFASDGIEPDQTVLSKLTEMSLCELWDLKQIWKGPAPCTIFCHVKVLAVVATHKLTYLFTSVVAQCLEELEDLSVKQCQKLQRVIEASEETVNNSIKLKKLKSLTLVELGGLTRFYGSIGSATEDNENIEFPSLERSLVERCRRFKSPASGRIKL